MLYIHNHYYVVCVQVIVYVFTNPVPALHVTSSVSVFEVQVTVEPVNVTLFNFVVMVAPVSAAVAVSVFEASVEFVVYAYVFGSNVGLKVRELNANVAKFPVKKPPWCPNPCTQQL